MMWNAKLYRNLYRINQSWEPSNFSRSTVAGGWKDRHHRSRELCRAGSWRRQLTATESFGLDGFASTNTKFSLLVTKYTISASLAVTNCLPNLSSRKPATIFFRLSRLEWRKIFTSILNWQLTDIVDSIFASRKPIEKTFDFGFSTKINSFFAICVKSRLLFVERR